VQQHCIHTFCLATSVNVGHIFLNSPLLHYDFENTSLKEFNFSVYQVLRLYSYILTELASAVTKAYRQK